MASLQDQLLKAGVVDKGKAQKIKKDKHRSAKQAPKGQQQDSEARRLAEKARQEKLEKDKEKNRKLKEAAEQKAIQAQLKQLVEMNRIDRAGGEVSYQFSHGKAIKKMYVTEQQQLLLTRGRIAIVEFQDGYELVPAPVAEKIAQRDEHKIVLLNTPESNQVDEDDPYAEYQIPDDLMW
ncbi:MAG: nucleoprotein/polynucleotide-associated enzyme [Gammaproteobacteria bacterium]|nr:MAG: nucleoprotein/polynucleotide-associated enzyme [Gammaproteobacteria bacterium]